MIPAWLRRQPRPKPYRERDFRRRERYRDDYLRLAGGLIELLDFDSAYDVGCGNGFLLEGFEAAGKRIGGVEASTAVRHVLPEQLADRILIDDFTAAAGAWELVSCVEVAEHIEPSRSSELVAAVAGLATRWVYFTAAPPGQAGHGHINCRPHEEWLAWFDEHGWREDAQRTEALRNRLSALEQTPWLQRNSFILKPSAPAAG